MGYAIVYGPCVCCGNPFSFHPHKVPSVRVEGKREPICRSCMEAANAIRVKNGLKAHPILEGAYDACEEHEL